MALHSCGHKFLALVDLVAIAAADVLQQMTQNVMDVIIWHAAYDQAIAKGATDADAVFEADSVIRRTIGDFSPENLSLFETGNAFTRRSSATRPPT